MTLLNKNIPNIISLIRIILVPIIFTLVVLIPTIHTYVINVKMKNYYYRIDILWIISGILFIIAALSDWLDGYIARKYNLVSDSGKLLDAIADKILVNATLIAFLYENIVPVWVVFLFITRDFCVDALKFILATKKDKIVAASKLGKYKTAFTMLGISLLFFINKMTIVNDLGNSITNMYSLNNQLLLIPIYIGVILSIWSGLHYFFSNIKFLKLEKK